MACVLFLYSSSHADNTLPLTLTLKSKKTIYKQNEALPVQLKFTALKETQLCLSRHLLQQLSFSIYHQKTTPIALEPYVVSHAINAEPQKITLKPGQTVARAVNLKQLSLENRPFWPSGEYRIEATFFLCPQEQEEKQVEEDIPILSQNKETLFISY